MRERREQVWSIAPDSASDGFLIAAFDRESALFELSRTGEAPSWRPIPLSGLMDRADPTVPKWSRRRVPASESRAIGSQLWNALPAPMRDILREPGPPLHLKIATDITAVADLPWEWLADDAGTPLALRPDVRLVRSVLTRFPVPSLSVDLPLRILLIVPNPKNEQMLDAYAETSAVTGRLRGSDYQVRVLEDASVDEMVQEMTAWLPHVVHYIGHGGLSHGEGNLILNGPDGRSRWVSAAELGRQLPSSVRLVCLSTCVTTRNYQILGLSHLSRAPGLVELPTTLTNQFPVGRPAAEAFWEAFYGGLVEHAGDATEAVHQARVTTAEADHDAADWASFSLAVRDQTGVPFAIGRSGADIRRRQSTELKAQFAAQLVNDLAAQVEVLGEDTPRSLRNQYETERTRAAGLLDELSEEG